MKRILSLFLLAMPLFCHGQNIYEINLSRTLDESRMGTWTKGDYIVNIELDLLEPLIRNIAKQYIDGTTNLNSEDSIATVFNLSGRRYHDAADLVKNSKNGLDLNKLVVYFGQENEKDNMGNSSTIENFVIQLVENGRATVDYKGERVFRLNKRHDSKGSGLDYGDDILIYFDDPENYIFKYYRHLGW